MQPFDLRIGISAFVLISLYELACLLACWNQPLPAPRESLCARSTPRRLCADIFYEFEVWSSGVDTTFCVLGFGIVYARTTFSGVASLKIWGAKIFYLG